MRIKIDSGNLLARPRKFICGSTPRRPAPRIQAAFPIRIDQLENRVAKQLVVPILGELRIESLINPLNKVGHAHAPNGTVWLFKRRGDEARLCETGFLQPDRSLGRVVIDETLGPKLQRQQGPLQHVVVGPPGLALIANLGSSGVGSETSRGSRLTGG